MIFCVHILLNFQDKRFLANILLTFIQLKQNSSLNSTALSIMKIEGWNTTKNERLILNNMDSRF